MNRLFLGLMLTAVAVGGSAFKNAKKAITENYIVQTSSGYFIRLATAPGGCTSSPGLHCEYAVTAFGRLYIPSKSYYTSMNIQDYLDDDWIEPIDGVGSGIYHPN